MSYHKLIYGVFIDEEDTDYKLVEEQDLHFLPMYGDPKGGHKIIGYEYGRVYGLYDKLRYTYEGILSFSDCKVPLSIKNKFIKNYPKLDAKCYAIIQNVYTSHYTSGTVICGYWLSFEKSVDVGSTKPTCEDEKVFIGDDDIGNDPDDEIHLATDIDLSDIDLSIMNCGHNMEDADSKVFVGKIIQELDTNEHEETCNKLATQLCSTYNHVPLPSRDEILKRLKKENNKYTLSEIPMLTMLQGMCYCCT